MGNRFFQVLIFWGCGGLFQLLLTVPSAAQVETETWDAIPVDGLDMRDLLPKVSPLIIPDLLEAGKVDPAHYRPGTIHIVLNAAAHSSADRYRIDFRLQGEKEVSGGGRGRQAAIATGCKAQFFVGGPQSPDYTIESSSCVQYAK